MSDDIISRHAAINELKKAYWDNDLHAAKDDPCVIDAMTDWAIQQIKALPSTDAEPPLEIQDILDYLDTVLHPIISPEHWNVYSELHGMISTLPPLEKQARWEHCEHLQPRYDIMGIKTWAEAYKCSNCGFIHTVIEDFGHYAFCPNCGAKMVNKDD